VTLTATERAALIETYRAGHAEVLAALDGITDPELDARPYDGEWTVREIVHHLADSEMTGAIRLRLLVATENPQIVGYDQEAFANRLYYDRPIAPSLEAFRAARATTAAILDRLTEAEWLREGTHSEVGRYTLTRWLELYAAHAHAHANQIRVARDAAKPR